MHNDVLISNLWSYADPRLSINKRANIVILRPSEFGRYKAGCGRVDTKEGWAIWTDFEDHPYYSADDEWDQDWCWIFAPQK